MCQTNHLTRLRGRLPTAQQFLNIFDEERRTLREEQHSSGVTCDDDTDKKLTYGAWVWME